MLKKGPVGLALRSKYRSKFYSVGRPTRAEAEWQLRWVSESSGEEEGGPERMP